jgi:hypothetical protein
LKLIAVATEDFEIYYELVRALRAQKTPFVSLSPQDPVPPDVGVVITTAREEPRIHFRPCLVVPGPDDRSVRMTVELAQEALTGKAGYENLTFGIDPGKRSGLAVLGDGIVIHTAESSSAEELSEDIRRILGTHSSKRVRFRVGHGDPPNRNRIVNALLEFGYPVEITDERSTSRGTRMPHVKAAMDIANTSGAVVRRMLETVPTQGEINDTKRLSRLASGGTVTISDRLAEKVLKGELSIEDAIRMQKRRVKKTVEPVSRQAG